jgi:hypothetical protein
MASSLRIRIRDWLNAPSAEEIAATNVLRGVSQRVKQRFAEHLTSAPALNSQAPSGRLVADDSGQH